MPSYQDRERAFLAGPKGSEPFDVWPGDVDRMPPFPFPRLYSDQRVEGWKLLRQISVKNTDAELRLFVFHITAGHGYSILEFSDFHITFGEYEKVEI